MLFQVEENVKQYEMINEKRLKDACCMNIDENKKI